MSTLTSATPPQAAEPVTVVIFGASGDLTQRKLVPALYNLFREGLLPERLRVLGYARRPKSDAQFRDEQRAGVAAHSRVQPIDKALWQRFAAGLHYHTARLGNSIFEPLWNRRYRSPWRSRSVWRAAAATTTAPAPSAIWCRTTCSRC